MPSGYGTVARFPAELARRAVGDAGQPGGRHEAAEHGPTGGHALGVERGEQERRRREDRGKGRDRGDRRDAGEPAEGDEDHERSQLKPPRGGRDGGMAVSGEPTTAGDLTGQPADPERD